MKKTKTLSLIMLTFVYLSSFGEVMAVDSELLTQTPTAEVQEVPTDNSVVPQDEEVDQTVVETPPVADEDIQVVDDLTSDTLTTDQGVSLQTSGDVPPIQDTYNSQDGSGSEALTTDTSTDIVLIDDTPAEEEQPIVDGDLTQDKSIDSEIDLVKSPKKEELLEEVFLEEEPEGKQQLDDDINYLSMEDLKPKAIYHFSVSHKKFKTERKSNNTEFKNFANSKKVDNDISESLSDNSGIMELNGSCNSTYFVVLLYKNKDDYLENQNKYILNKAFPCVDNSFNYKVEDLPKNLEDGLYYMLIGQQGDTGSWTPISDLAEININKNQNE